jgi:hypothetical protein
MLPGAYSVTASTTLGIPASASAAASGRSLDRAGVRSRAVLILLVSRAVIVMVCWWNT